MSEISLNSKKVICCGLFTHFVYALRADEAYDLGIKIIQKLEQSVYT